MQKNRVLNNKKICTRNNLIVVITGSIASGKSYMCRYLHKLGFITLDSDKLVHDIIQNEAREQIFAVFGQGIVGDDAVTIDRVKLGDEVFMDRGKLKLLENILHPLVQQKRLEIINKVRRKTRRSIIVETPLLFDADKCKYDVAISTIIRPAVQYFRATLRKNMTREKFTAIVTKQHADVVSTLLVNYFIDTSGTKLAVKHYMRSMIKHGRFTRNSTRYRDLRTKVARRTQAGRNRMCRINK
ncbi:Dephospho-CoA kinase [Alphaproteobacteria bacterium]